MESQSNDQLAIGLVGHGSMGREIERLASSEGCRIAAIFDSTHPLRAPLPALDAAIDFTHPDALRGNAEILLRAGIPTVVGTTGWLSRIDDIRGIVEETGGRLIYGSNFSIGVNILFRLASEAARLFNARSNYDVGVHEIHHTRKADSPSGTALTLARLLLEGIDRKSSLLTGPPEGRIAAEALQITSQRIGATIGTHVVTFDSDADTIELTHTAKNRSGFALGALLAARWLTSPETKPGLYRFEDLF
jgi:4-hydroxy-tetrahydrodipicolinate reductase